MLRVTLPAQDLLHLLVLAANLLLQLFTLGSEQLVLLFELMHLALELHHEL